MPVNKPGFVPRPSARRVTARVVGWTAALPHPGGEHWVVTAGVWTGVGDRGTKAVAATVRRVLKKRGHWVSATSPGGVVTAKPVGTRMGKGKGKPHDHRTWWSCGQPVGYVVGTPTGVGVLTKRTAARVKLTPAGW